MRNDGQESDWTQLLRENYAPWLDDLTYGVECPDGWRSLIEATLESLVAAVGSANRQVSEYPLFIRSSVATAKEPSVMTRHISGARHAHPSSLTRRRVLRDLLSGSLVVMVGALAGCGSRRDLPPERRTRGKFGGGHQGEHGGRR